MAEEKLDISGRDGKNSGRSSLAGAGSATSREKTLSRYLRASTGSCHDFCKHGKKHDSEENTQRPWKRNIKKPCVDPNLFRSLDLQQRKKTSAAESKSFPNSRSRAPDMLHSSTRSPDVNNSRIHDVLLKREKTPAAMLKPKHSPNFSSGRKTSDVSMPDVSTNSSNSQTSREHEVQKKTSMAKLRSSTNLKSHLSDAPKVMHKGGLSSSKKVEISSKAKEKSFSKPRSTPSKMKSQPEKLPSASLPSKGLVSVKRSNGISDAKMGKSSPTSKVAVKKALASPRVSSSPRASLARPTSITARKNQNRDLKAVPLQKNQNKVEKAETEQPLDEQGVRNNDSLEEKTLYVIKMETENILLESDKNENCTAELSPRVASSPKSSALPMSPPCTAELSPRVASSPKSSALPMSPPCTAELSPRIASSPKSSALPMSPPCTAELSPRVASSPKSSALPMSPPLSSSGGRDEDESEYTEDDSDSDYYEDDEVETVNTGEVELLAQENGGRHRKGRMVSSNEKDCRPVKLSFRRGKVVDIESESNSPRRLKFRRARLLGVTQNVKAERRSFRTREVGDMNDNKPSGEKVVLRHQDLQGKKNEKGLFNNVIEETASKLVETRKSKVKALVGAFETVISLQDAKSSLNTSLELR